MSSIRVSLLGVLVIALASCGTARDFVRDTGQVHEYEKEFSASRWLYEDYLLARSSFLDTGDAHESVVIQVATEIETGKEVVSIVYQSYADERQHENTIDIIVDGSVYSLSSPEPALYPRGFSAAPIEKYVILLDESVINALLVANDLSVRFISAMQIDRQTLRGLQSFLDHRL